MTGELVIGIIFMLVALAFIGDAWVDGRDDKRL
jgi:hypothetical protein